MIIKQLKEQIKTNIEEIEQFDLSKLSPTNATSEPWKKMEKSEIDTFANEVCSTLIGLKSKLDLLDVSGFDNIHSLNDSIKNFINSFNQLSPLDTNSLTTQHHDSLERLSRIDHILRGSSLYLEIKFSPTKLENTLKTIDEVSPFIKDLLANKDTLQEAIGGAKEWIQSREKMDEYIIKEHAKAFLNRAKEHEKYKKIKRKLLKWEVTDYVVDWWLVFSFIFGAITFYLTYSFYKEAKETITVGQAILRISTLLIPAYFSLFCSNQFLYHKKMYEAYMFKYSSLETMNNLINLRTERMQERIFDKALTVIFSEPTIKSDGEKYNKQLVTELISMLKSQLK